MIRPRLLLPAGDSSDVHTLLFPTDADASERLQHRLNRLVRELLDHWTKPQPHHPAPDTQSPDAVTAQVLHLLTSRPFTSQARGRLASPVSLARPRVQRHVEANRPLTLFLLYHGGYRASPLAHPGTLIDRPDQTELLLLHQIARLREALIRFYAPGLHFTIVINNGVAEWANDIPLWFTEGYVARLRGMIARLGAASSIHVLVQSELPSSRPPATLPTDAGLLRASPQDHAMIERFLGRRCSEVEAHARLARYALAERAWHETLVAVTDPRDAIVFRQVPHEGMLSFRPYPGGAIRVQNGTLGFLDEPERLTGRLVTSESHVKHDIRLVPLDVHHLPSWDSEEPHDA